MCQVMQPVKAALGSLIKALANEWGDKGMQIKQEA